MPSARASELRILPSPPAALFYLVALPYLALLTVDLLECSTAPGYPWGCECAGPKYARVEIYRETAAIEELWICAALLLFACRRLSMGFAIGGITAFSTGVVATCTGAVAEVVAATRPA